MDQTCRRLGKKVTPAWQIHYADQVVDHDIPSLTSAVRDRIRRAIESKLMTDPLHFGKPLRDSLSGHRSLRVGDYRVLYRLAHEERAVHIVAIAHRRDIYEDGA